MGMNEKLDPELATRLRDFLKSKHIENKRIVINVETETIELDDARADVKWILDAPAELTIEEAQAAIENIRRSREEWG